MSRTPNDDRSDVRNPTSDAYAADQANRYGDNDSSDARGVAAAAVVGPPYDSRFGPDPHPILGRRSNRLPGLSRNFESQPEIPNFVPWTETLALTFATDETDARDRTLAIDELMAVSAWLFQEAAAVAVRQEHAPVVERSETGGDIELAFRFSDSRSVVVRAMRQLELVSLAGPRGHSRGFRFSALRWQEVELERSDDGRAIIGYRRERVADPTIAIVDALRACGGRSR
jgi:hypothetical protein